MVGDKQTERIAEEDGEILQWLLNCEEPWTRYRTFSDLLLRPETDSELCQAREQMLAHPQVQALVAAAKSWPGYALKRHNDAAHPLYALSTLADFGLQATDPGLGEALERVLAHQSAEGAFQTQIRLQKRFGGLDGEYWTWMACDAPTLLYVLLAMGLGDDPRVSQAAEHLLALVDDNGWRCTSDSELGNFRGPGRKTDPCPIANVYALKALTQRAEWMEYPAVTLGIEMLLGHWERQNERKMYLFGIGTDFRKLKYPMIWYDILHVTDVLSRFPKVTLDPRFREMLKALTKQADEHGRYTATSMYRAWKDFSFAGKKHPSPWLTYLVKRIERRVATNVLQERSGEKMKEDYITVSNGGLK